MSEERLPDELTGVEAALASIALKTSRLDRDRVLFLAGQAAAGVRAEGRGFGKLGAGWLWPCATAASLALAATFGAMLIHRGGASDTGTVARIEPVKPVRAEVAKVDRSDSESVPLRTDYLKLRALVLASGVDAMPDRIDSSSSEERIPTPADAHRKWTDSPHG